MNKTLIFRKIGGIISEITEQYQYLAESPENINPLELELFVANAHFLSEHLAILKKLENTREVPPSLIAEKSIAPLDSITEATPPAEELVNFFMHEEAGVVNEAEQVFELPAELTEPEESPIPEVEEPEVEAVESIPVETEVVPDDNVRQDVDLKQEETVYPSNPEPVKAVQEANDSRVFDPQKLQPLNEVQGQQQQLEETKTPAEEKVPTLNEILAAGKSNENIAAKISRAEDKDLRSMIKLNDKLMFVRDLFNGYSLAYSEAIDLLNRFDNFKAAENFLLQNYASKNRWSEKQQTVDQFYEVLNKRFS